MSATSSIEWTDRTWNPIRGCSLVSPGCASCYAMKQAHRFSGPGRAYEGLTRLGPNGPTWTGAIRTVPNALDEPLHWRTPQRIFVNSMSDLFHPDVPDAFIDQVFAVMALCPQHTFQVLTKRAERMRAYLHRLTARLGELWDLTNQPTWLTLPAGRSFPRYPENWPLPNVWLGVSVENQHFADERIPLLLQTPAGVRFISTEPLLGAVDLQFHFGVAPNHDDLRGLLNWVIVGGESGSGARPFNVAWARSIVQQCKAAGVPAFYKQGGTSNSCRHDQKGGCIDCMPLDLQVREFPNAARS